MDTHPLTSKAPRKTREEQQGTAPLADERRGILANKEAEYEKRRSV
jgi:hypothetical protein